MRIFIFFEVVYLALFAIASSCSNDFLETYPQSVLSEHVLTNKEGIDHLLIGAYAMIDGYMGNYPGVLQATSPTNWVWGSIAADDGTKGSDSWDESSIDPVDQKHSLTPNSNLLSEKWAICYEGVARCNDVLRVLDETHGLDDKYVNSVKAQALFLRAWQHFELKRVFNNIPYIAENAVNPGTIPNTVDVWLMIQADLQFAVQHLPEEQSESGRPTCYAAMTVLARVHLFQQEWQDAANLLDQVIVSGKFSLMPNFHDNYRIPTRNNQESVYEIQYAVNDGTEGSANGGWGDAITFPNSNEVMNTCCGFHQPTQNLVNAFRVDSNGLPFLDLYNDKNLKNDMGIDSDSLFIPTPDMVDPRLDWTVGRRGIPFLDWAVMRGKDWIRDQEHYGPYIYKKNMFYKSEQNTYSTATGWLKGVNANNYRAYRYAHVLLWRAECAVELNDLELARNYVNMVRIRARDGSRVMGLCNTYRLSVDVVPNIDYTKPAANYNVQPYPAFPDQIYARKAVRMELRLEFAMEGQRFFDLVRWGIAAETINAYIEKDRICRPKFWTTSSHFKEGINEYWPIPQSAIDEEGSDVLVQNPGY